MVVAMDAPGWPELTMVVAATLLLLPCSTAPAADWKGKTDRKSTANQPRR